MADVWLRPTTSADRPFVRALSETAFARFGDYRALLPAWLADPGVLGFVAMERGEPVGLAMLGFYFAGAAGGACFADLLALGVVPSAQRRGVARRLLAHALEAAERAPGLDVRDVRLTVAEDNAPARALFASAGFAPLDEDAGTYDGGQRALRLSLPLPR